MLPSKTAGCPDGPQPSRHSLRNRVDWESHLEVLPLAAWIEYPDSGGVYVNQAFRSVLALTRPEDIEDGRWMDFLHPKDRRAYVRSWNTFLTNNAAYFKEKVRWVRPDNGQTIRLKVWAQRLSNGKLQGWIRENHADQALAKLEELIS